MRRSGVYALVGVIVAAVLIASQMPINTTPRIIKDPLNESLPETWLERGGSLDADFEGHFYVSVIRYFGIIRLWITPREGARTTYIRVEVRRDFLNGLYLEVEPPGHGEVEISQGESQNGMLYIIQVKDLGEAGKGTYEMTFIDEAPEKSLSMDITVEVRDGLLKYRGELPVLVMEPFSNLTWTG